MSLVGKLIGFGLRQVVGVVTGDEAAELTGRVAGSVIRLVEQRFTDHSQTLPKALARANDRAWQALSVALAGDGFLDKIKVFFASGDDKSIREQVQLFLQDKNIALEGTSAEFRKQCLTELLLTKQARLLSAETLSPTEIARQTASFKRYADTKGMVDGAEQVIGQIADALALEFPNLGKLLRHRPAGGPPLLIAAFAYFFRREVETNDELAHGLFFDGLRQLAASQAKAFGEVNKALISMDDKFDPIIEQLGRIETVVVETHGAVLDMQIELQRLGSLHLGNAEEVRRLMQEVLLRVDQAGMRKGEVKPHHSCSIHGEEERNIVKVLLARFRQMPADRQKQCPALLNGLGKLQVGSGDFAGARRTFVAVAENVRDATAQAEAQFNAFRAALEEKKWSDALAAIQQAATLDTQRFAPFALQRYQPKKILGAGGFGTAFLCHDRFFNAEVVVKTLHDAALERNMNDVFREAQLLGQLQHPAIIGVRDCNYADLSRMARPYIVMDYFPGGSLQNFVQEQGAIAADALISVARQIAQGMQAAHQRGILHRDLKPDNVLVRKEGDQWKVKIIDFGLALGKQTIETSMATGAARNTILGDSVAGTFEYAPPEQMGKLKGVRPGPYSDVYAFGKMCCYALFKTTEPKNRHWATVSKELHEMLEQCTEQELERRLPSFEPVMKVLESLDPQGRKAEAERKRREEEATEQKRQAVLRQQSEEEGRQKSEAERKPREEEDAARQKKETERLKQAGETKLIQFVRGAMDRTQGKPSQEDTAGAKEIVKQHHVSSERAKQIVADVRDQWQKAHPPKAERKLPKRSSMPRWSLWGILGGIAAIALIVVIAVVMRSNQDKHANQNKSIDGMLASPTETSSNQDNHANQNKKIDGGKQKPYTENYIGMKFAWVPPGTFLMGSPQNEAGRSDNETQHKVTLTKGFYMGVHLVTQEQWQEVMGKNPSRFMGEKNLPVEQVPWNDCQEFIKKLREKDKEKRAYRLPTEAEWEYACRAGTTTPFHFGETISTEQANYNGEYVYENGKKGVDRRKTTPVGTFPANAWGLHDMHGNLWQWCQDFSGDYPKIDVTDPQGPEKGGFHVLRGGSWIDSSVCCRSASRSGGVPGYRRDFCGFRLCFCLD